MLGHESISTTEIYMHIDRDFVREKSFNTILEKLSHHTNIWKLFVIKGILWFMIIMPIIVLFFQDNGLNLQQIMTLQHATHYP